MRAVGIDLSLVSTGLACARRDPDLAVDVQLVTPKRLTGLKRLRWVRDQVAERTVGSDPDVVILEGPAYGATAGQRGHHERGGLWWAVLDVLDAAGVRVLIAPPAAVKTYATGKGNASKSAIAVEVARRFPMVPAAALATDDASDAVVLAALGAAYLSAPVVDVPSHHRKAVTTLTPAPTGRTPAP